RPLDGRQLLSELSDDLAPVELLAAVGVAVDRDQHLRRDLREPIDEAARAEVRRAARPDRPETRACEQSDERLGGVRDHRDDAVATPDAEPAQPRGGGGYRATELGP